ncbi:GUN4-like [Microcystis aeruginosa PCC 9807]|uniref:GUN4-like n=1 Tax=Microcystis aeruginosa PCC 9807 TaxID=1160283 RepID=I4HC15_MICAE|nr:CHAT domain-containing protein [Microcystis aeruginosa]CCI19589.1 GUN4-like [Microcystis aeruginosa PCC 9807]
MKILHIDLQERGSNSVEFRFFWDNPNQTRTYTRSLSEIKNLSGTADTDYYTRLPKDHAKTGQGLYRWLDGTERILQSELDSHRGEKIVLAISTSNGLVHLPWELLHDGQGFLVEKRPAIIPVRWFSNNRPNQIVSPPQNRPLNLLFMATSPLGVEPVLDYEAEEGQILAATERTPVNLRVEESGCLNELGYVVREYNQGYFDVFHLTGHATHQDGKPCFLTEDEYGNRVDSDTNAIYDAIARSSLPPLIFLSGCRTGYAPDSAVPSMAAEFLHLGAKAVLGWGERVLDTDAAVAAKELYGHLSQGETVIEALSATYRALIDQQARDWHKLRLYVGNTLPQALVTPLRTPKRTQLPKPTITREFRDDENRLRVVKREEFVGRRRQLQNCLRTLKTDSEKVGVLIHGMGGWGKSSIASRLWERLPESEKILWWRQIDEVYLIRKLKDKLINPETRELIADLENNQLELKSRLSYLFSRLAELGEKPFLLILDDFEWNLEPRDGRYILKAPVAPILAALVTAIQETGTDHRILITCRYEFDSDLLEAFFLQGLEPFRKAELTKKLARLANFTPDQLPEPLRERALNLADGNPRLLEFLNNDILGREDAEAQLAELENSPDLWKDKIIWQELYQLIDEPLQQVLSHCLVYEIPVPMVALEAVCHSLTNYQQQLQRARELGLLEISPELEEENQLYRVSRILPNIISSIQLPDQPEVYSLYAKAQYTLHQLWGNKENKNEERWVEIFRLAFAETKNPDRFREQFDKMISVQYNRDADRAYEKELRKQREHLIANQEQIYQNLEEYLEQQDWKKADYETAFIMYQWMVIENYDDFICLFTEVSLDVINEIDCLWMQYSERKFGIKGQARIYRDPGGTEDYNREVWERFGDCVGWRKEGIWLELENIEYPATADLSDFTFPILIYHHFYQGGGGGIVYGAKRISTLASRLESQDI